MNDQIGKALLEAVNRLNSDTFGNKKQFIVDATHSASPSGIIMESVIVLEDTTDFSASNLRLTSGSGDYPTILKVGTQIPSGVYDITLTSGALLCIYK